MIKQPFTAGERDPGEREMKKVGSVSVFLCFPFHFLLRRLDGALLMQNWNLSTSSRSLGGLRVLRPDGCPRGLHPVGRLHLSPLLPTSPFSASLQPLMTSLLFPHGSLSAPSFAGSVLLSIYTSSCLPCSPFSSFSSATPPSPTGHGHCIPFSG